MALGTAHIAAKSSHWNNDFIKRGRRRQGACPQASCRKRGALESSVQPAYDSPRISRMRVASDSMPNGLVTIDIPGSRNPAEIAAFSA